MNVSWCVAINWSSVPFASAAARIPASRRSSPSASSVLAPRIPHHVECVECRTWISNRRTERSKGRLPVARIAELDALDMVWDVHEELWQRGIAAAREYREANGHLRVPKNLVIDGGFRVGSWISNRRVDRNKGRLPAERIVELDALEPVVTSIPADVREPLEKIAMEYGWLIGGRNEPDGSKSWVVLDSEGGTVLKSGVADSWDDARIAMIEDLYPPSEEGRRA